MKKTLITLLVIPCLARGISAQGLQVVPAGDTVHRVSIDSDSAFHPIDLQRAIQLAQRNAPVAVQARGQIRSANSSVKAAYAALLPGVALSLGQVNQSGDRMDAQGRIVPYAGQQPWSYSTGLNATMRVFDGGRNWSQIAQSKADVNSAEANDVAQQFNVALQVKTQYYAILAARESEAAASTQLDQAQAELRAAAARVRAGAATLSDSLRSVIQVGNARLALLTAQNNLRIASAALTRLVAAPYLVTAAASDTLDLALAPIDSATLLQLAERGPAVSQATAQLASAQAAVRAARAPYLPTVDLSYSKAGNGFDQVLWIEQAVRLLEQLPHRRLVSALQQLPARERPYPGESRGRQRRCHFARRTSRCAAESRTAARVTPRGAGAHPDSAGIGGVR